MKADKDIPIAKSIDAQIQKIPEGIVFDYSYFKVPPSAELALAKALSRLKEKGFIERIAKGSYYKPRVTAFGRLRPPENELIKSLTTKEGKRIGYLTGPALYNRLGLTGQVPTTLTIATNRILPPKQFGGYKVKYSKRNGPITDKNIPLLQLLDALKDIAVIPDSDVNESFSRILDKISRLTPDEKKGLLKEASTYNPATRALVGALYEQYLPGYDVRALKTSLNPLSTYKIGLSQEGLPNQSNWNIA